MIEICGELDTYVMISYSGETRLAAPTPSPTILLPIVIPSTVTVSACHNAPNPKRLSATKITDLRPNRSASIPASGLAIKANKLVQDVTRLLSSTVKGRLDRSVPTETSVEEMTPVLELRIQC